MASHFCPAEGGSHSLLARSLVHNVESFVAKLIDKDRTPSHPWSTCKLSRSHHTPKCKLSFTDQPTIGLKEIIGK